jgi:hypothetical protein
MLVLAITKDQVVNACASHEPAPSQSVGRNFQGLARAEVCGFGLLAHLDSVGPLGDSYRLSSSDEATAFVRGAMYPGTGPRPGSCHTFQPSVRHDYSSGSPRALMPETAIDHTDVAICLPTKVFVGCANAIVDGPLVSKKSRE